MKLELTELCAVSVRERVLARVSLGGWMVESAWRAGTTSPDGTASPDGESAGSVSLHVEVSEIVIEQNGARAWLPLEEYTVAEVDPLHLGAAEQLQHLAAQHPEAISLMSRLCDRASMIGAVRVLPIALDRYGIVLRIERLRDHRDVRLPFRSRVGTGTEAALEMRHLLSRAQRQRPCR